MKFLAFVAIGIAPTFAQLIQSPGLEKTVPQVEVTFAELGFGCSFAIKKSTSRPME